MDREGILWYTWENGRLPKGMRVMFGHARNCAVPIEGTQMAVAAFGRGERHLVMIPGLGDGLRTVKGLAASFAVMYRAYARAYRVYVFSRRDDLPAGHTTRDMARDIRFAMGRLGMERADVLGISQGGMIAQHLAIEHPQAVSRLVLAVTSSRPNDVLSDTVGRWIKMAREGDYAGLMIDTAERSYTEKKLRQYRQLYPILTRVGRPRDFGRFITQAESCISHDACGALGAIDCPTLVIGGKCDRVVGAQASREIAARVAGSRLLMYEGLGHGAYEEAKDFHARVLAFLRE